MKQIICYMLFACISLRAQIDVSIPSGEIVATDLNGINTIKIPFNSEYKIRLKNNDSYRRCLVKIWIDGKPVVDDGLILRKSETIKLERFIDGNLKTGSKFKFIPKNAAEASGVRMTEKSGLIEIEAQYEQSENIIRYKERVLADTLNIWHLYDWQGIPNASIITPLICDSLSIINGINFVECSQYSDGITIKGSESFQRFQEVEIGKLQEPKQTLVIKLVGYWKEKPILLNRGEK